MIKDTKVQRGPEIYSDHHLHVSNENNRRNETRYEKGSKE
jgi:hypothetical protein